MEQNDAIRQNSPALHVKGNSLLSADCRQRILYAITGTVIGLSGGLGVQVLSVANPDFVGYFHLTYRESAFFIASYMAAYATGNILLFKLRQQSRLDLFISAGMFIFAVSMIAQFFVTSYVLTFLLHLIAGFSAATTSTACVLYMIPVFPKEHIAKAFIFSMGILQLPQYFIWMAADDLLTVGGLRNIYLFAFGASLFAVGLSLLVRLPCPPKIRAIERGDLLTYVLLLLCFYCIAVSLIVGRISWWTESSEVARFIIAALVLMAIITFIESRRSNPTIRIDWLLSPEILIILAGGILLRLINSAEQNYAFVGIMRSYGFSYDQLSKVFVFSVAGVISGTIITSFLAKDRFLPWLLVVTALILATASGLGSQMTSLSRPSDFIFPQFLTGFGAGMFLGPILSLAIKNTYKKGLNYMVLMSASIALSQYYGGLTASSLMGSYSTIVMHQASVSIKANLKPGNPAVLMRIQQENGNRPVAGPLQEAAIHNLQPTVNREAKVRAYSAVLELNCILCALYCAVMGLFYWLKKRKNYDYG